MVANMRDFFIFIFYLVFIRIKVFNIYILFIEFVVLVCSGGATIDQKGAIAPLIFYLLKY